MSSRPGRSTTARVRSLLARLASRRAVVLLLTGVLAGVSMGVIDQNTVSLPVVGSAPGALVGAVGLVVALGVYQRGSCCADCGENDCGCAGDCGDSCSYDP